MRWISALWRWFKKPLAVSETTTFDELGSLFTVLSGKSVNYRPKLGLEYSVTMYSADLRMLMGWVEMAIATIDMAEYVPEKWKRNQELIKRFSLDDYLAEDGVFYYPEETIELVLRKAKKLHELMTQSDLDAATMEYYRRQFRPIMDDLTQYLVAVTRCCKLE